MLLGGLGGFCLGLISCSFVVVLLSSSVLALQTGGEVNPTPESSLQTVWATELGNKQGFCLSCRNQICQFKNAS